MAGNPGIYQILNKVSGKRYIGSAANLRTRKNGHIHDLRAGNHHNVCLQRAYNKYGEDALVFMPILECDKSDRLWIEQVYIDACEPEYNIAKTAGKGHGRKPGFSHSKKTRTKMAEAATKWGDKCLIDWCDKKPRGHGLCSTHLERLRVHGSTSIDNPRRGNP